MAQADPSYQRVQPLEVEMPAAPRQRPQERPARVNGFSPPFTPKQIMFCVGNAASYLYFVVLCLVFIRIKPEANMDDNHTYTFWALFKLHGLLGLVGFASWLFIELHPPTQRSCFSSWMPDIQRWNEYKYCRDHKAKLEGLDHFCMWLNTGIARSNYAPFMILTACGSLQYIVQDIVGLLMLTVWRHALAEKAGRNLLWMVLAVLVNLVNSVCFTFSFVMLVYFHAHLWRAQQSTYDFIIEQRKKHQQQDHQNKPGSFVARRRGGPDPLLAESKANYAKLDNAQSAPEPGGEYEQV